MRKKIKKRKGIFTYILLLINYLLVIGLGFSYLSVYVNPAFTSFFAFFGLVYPLLIFLNIIVIILWIILWKRYFLLSLIFILLGWNVMNRHFNMSSECKIIPDNAFKVMSYNVQNLSNNNLHIQDESLRDKIFSTLNTEKPDIICMQEFYYSGSNKTELINDLQKSLNLPYSYKKNYFQSNSKIDALITFSKFPIVSKGFIKNNDGRVLLIYTDLIINNDTIRLLNIHMQSFKFKQEDLDFVKEFGKSGAKGELSVGSKNIIRRLHNAYILRSDESRVFEKFAKKSKYPLIVCGDFNDTPASYTYHAVSNKLIDSFVKSGSGIAKTYTESLLPLRIDYILYDDHFASCNYKTHEAYYLSDHYPVSCYVYNNK